MQCRTATCGLAERQAIRPTAYSLQHAPCSSLLRPERLICTQKIWDFFTGLQPLAMDFAFTVSRQTRPGPLGHLGTTRRHDG